MKIKVGGVYKTRNGERVEIVEYDDSHYIPFWGDNDMSYTLEGRFGPKENTHTT